MERKYDVFISYRRDGGESTARILHDRLTAMGYSVFFDVESLRSGAFNTKLYSVIGECQDFVIVLSPNALDRCVNADDWVRQEVAHALAKGKNVIPVMLRNFVFPEQLPEDIDKLRNQNGVMATPEYFDAFMKKLAEFMISKPHRKLRRVIAAVMAAVIALSVWAAASFLPIRYPGTRAEENLTQEVIYYVGNHLIHYSLLAESQEDALEAAQRYLSTGSADITTMESALAVSRNAVQIMDVSAAAPSEDFVGQLRESPFSTADMTAMHDELVQFQKECEDRLAAVEFLVSEECMLTDSEKLQALGYYQDYLEENMKAIAYFTNQMLLPITEESALDPLWEEILPQVRSVPLNAANWGDDYDALQNAAEECLNNMEHAVMGQYGILGNMTIETAQQKAIITDLYVKMGYTRTRAERIVEDIIFNYEAKQQTLTKQHLNEGYSEEEAASLAEKQIRLMQIQAQIRMDASALVGDDWQTLWEKMMLLLSCDLYDEARECMELYIPAAEATDRNVQAYMPAVLKFIDQMELGGIRYGVVVTAQEEETPDTLLQVGDIIVAFDGKPCTSAAGYLEYKEQLTQSSYTLSILRTASEAGALELVELEMTKEMSPVGMYTLTEI